MNKPYMIRISSYKGGVGKTTIAVNLAIAMGINNYRVLLVDDDTASPAVGFILGLQDAKIGTMDVIARKANIKRAIIRHSSGIDVLPSILSERNFPNEDMLATFLDKLKTMTEYDFIIVDTAPGYLFSELGRAYDEAAIISTMTTTSIASALRFDEAYKREGVSTNFVLNMTHSSPYEANVKDVEDTLGRRAIAAFPEDITVLRSESAHMPVYLYKDNAPFSVEMNTLFGYYAAKAVADKHSSSKPQDLLGATDKFVKKIIK